MLVSLCNIYRRSNSICVRVRLHINVKGKGKGKAIPLQAWVGPEGSRKSRLPDFKTIDT